MPGTSRKNGYGRGFARAAMRARLVYRDVPFVHDRDGCACAPVGKRGRAGAAIGVANHMPLE